MAAGSWLPFWLSGWGRPVDLTGQTVTEPEAATGTLTIHRNLAWQHSAGLEAVTATLSRTVRLTGQCHSLSTTTVVTSGLQITKALAAHSSQAQALTGAVKVSRPLSGQVQDIEAFVAALKVTRPLTGTMAALEVVAANSPVSRFLSGQTVTEAQTFTGQIKVTRAFGVTTAEQSHLTGALTAISRYLAGAVGELEDAAGDLQVGAPTVHLSGRVNLVSTFTGQLSVSRKLTGPAITGLEIVGAGARLTINRRLAPGQDLTEVTAVTGRLRLVRAFSGQINGNLGHDSGSLLVRRNLAGPGGIVTGQIETLSAHVEVTRYLTGQPVTEQEILSGQIDRGQSQPKALTGQVDEVSHLTGALRITRAFTGHVAESEALPVTVRLVVVRRLTGSIREVEVLHLVVTPDFLGQAIAAIAALVKSQGTLEVLPGAGQLWGSVAALPGATSLIEALAKALAGGGGGVVTKAIATSMAALDKATAGQTAEVIIAKAGAGMAIVEEDSATGLLMVMADRFASAGLNQQEKGRAALVEEPGATVTSTATIEIGS